MRVVITGAISAGALGLIEGLVSTLNKSRSALAQLRIERGATSRHGEHAERVGAVYPGGAATRITGTRKRDPEGQ